MVLNMDFKGFYKFCRNVEGTSKNFFSKIEFPLCKFISKCENVKLFSEQKDIM